MRNLEILFRNEHFVVVDKPPGWLSVSSRMGERDPRPCVGRVLETQLDARVWPVHRLDEEVTGLLVFALTPPAHSAANSWFENSHVGKTYEAWSDVGSTAPPPVNVRQLWKAVLLRGKRRAYESPHGKPARTDATFLGRIELAGLPMLAWELVPETGRAHQLRWELARQGFPIVGDVLYGARTPFLPDAIALRCVKLDFARAMRSREFSLPPTLDAPSLEVWRASSAAGANP